MTTINTKISGGSITLPRELKEVWQNAEVYIRGDNDSILIKRLNSPKFLEMLDELNKIGRVIPKKIVNEALKSVKSFGLAIALIGRG